MPNLPISGLASGASVSGTDLFPDVQTPGVGPVKVTAAQIAAYSVQNGSLIADNTTTSRSLAARFADYYNVKDFGAVADGITDDTAAFNAAINQAGEFGSVYAPPGLYKVNGILIHYRGMNIHIDGRLLVNAGETAITINVTSPLPPPRRGNIFVNEIYSNTGNRPQNNSVGINMIQAGFSIIRFQHIHNLHYGIKITPSGLAGCGDVRYTGNLLDFCYYGIYSYTTGNVNDPAHTEHTMVEVNFISNYAYGIYKNGGGASQKFWYVCTSFDGFPDLNSDFIADIYDDYVDAVTGLNACYYWDAFSSAGTASPGGINDYQGAAFTTKNSNVILINACRNRFWTGNFKYDLSLTKLTVDNDRYQILSSTNPNGYISIYPDSRIDVVKTVAGVPVNMVQTIAADGNIRITRNTGGGYIDFATNIGDAFDTRIQSLSNGLVFYTGGNGFASVGLTINSSQNTIVQKSLTINSNAAIAGSPITGVSLSITGNSTGSAFSRGIYVNQIVKSDVINSYTSYRSEIATDGSSFSMARLYHFRTQQGSLGSTTITDQVGYYVPASNLTGASYNAGFWADNNESIGPGKIYFGFRSNTNIATGGGTAWNFFVDGTAPNSFAGDVLIGTQTTGASKLIVADSSIQVNSPKTPASASDTGTQGQICWDSNYVYVCIATNTWKRSAITTW